MRHGDRFAALFEVFTEPTMRGPALAGAIAGVIIALVAVALGFRP